MRFYALMVHEMCEGVAQRGLQRLGVHGVAPLIVEKHRVRNRIVARHGPIFRGYVFVRLPTLQDRGREMPAGWLDVERLRGANRFVRFGSESFPKPLPVGFVEGIEALIDDKGVIGDGVSQWRGHIAIDPLRARIAAKRKTAVIIRDVESVFCGLAADVDVSDVARALLNLDARGRLRILMRIMNAVVPFEVDRDKVEVVSAFDRDVRASRSSTSPTRTTVKRTA